LSGSGLSQTCVDIVGPVILISGVEDGALTNQPVAPSYSATDEELRSVSATLDGTAFLSGTAISGEGSHLLTVIADDESNNISTEQRSFTLDFTSPVIVISGVANGEKRNSAVTITFSASDLHFKQVTATLNGNPFLSGDTVSAASLYTLIVTAEDLAGNLASEQRIFQLDFTGPTIEIAGVTEGEITRVVPVIPSFQANDPLLDTVTATLNGQSFTSGNHVAAEGSYELIVTARDLADNSTVSVVHFTIDVTPPTITVTGIADEELRNAPATIVYSASDTHLDTVTAALDSVSFASGGTVSSEGDHSFAISAMDRAGNSMTRSIQFTIDSSAPAIAISGVTEGQMSKTALVPTIVITDAHPGSSTIRLDGVDFVSGSQVSAEGIHTLTADSTDLAGNSAGRQVQFTIDMTAPQIALTGVTDGQMSRTPVTPVFSVTDTYLQSTTATLDGQSFASGTAVSSEGQHTLAISASDQATNSTVRQVVFTIDTTPPVLQISGVANGEIRNSAVSITFSASDAHLGQVTATVDGSPISTGTSVSSEGDHVLVVTAVDEAGNSSSENRAFTLDFTAPVLSINGIANGDRRNSAVTITYSASDLHPKSVNATLNETAFATGTTVSTEGAYTLVVTAEDLAGNTATEQRVFQLDFSAPSIAITGVSDGQYSRNPLTIEYQVLDPLLETITATLNAESFASGTTVSAEGGYDLVVQAEDFAGNTANASVHFTIDFTPPSVSITGVTDGELRNSPATISFEATDANADTLAAVLDDVTALTSGGTVSAEGEHEIVVTATDKAGNSATETVGFTVDSTAPAIQIAGVAAGETRNTAVTITFSATDSHFKQVSATVDGSPISSGDTVSNEGNHLLLVTAEDDAGNTASEERSFTLDFTDPVITISGVSNGEKLNFEVTITFSASDLHFKQVTATLNGNPFTSGGTVSTANLYTLIVTAEDLGGNIESEQRIFQLDFSGPTIEIAGVTEGEITRIVPVIPTFQANDPLLDTVAATLNGQSFTSGTQVTAEGSYELVVTARDLADNSTIRVVHFSIDQTAPAVAITGVVEGELRNSPATISYTVDDLNLDTVNARVDGATFASGGTVSGSGVHSISITATDKAGNQTVEQRSFTIDSTAPAVVIDSPADLFATRENSVELVVAVTENGALSSVTVGGTSLTASPDGKYRTTLSLSEGANFFEIRALDTAGNATVKGLTLIRDTTAPLITLTAPVENAKVGVLLVEVKGSVSDSTAVTLTVNGRSTAVASDGSFATNAALTVGPNTITVVGTDALANSSTVTRSVEMGVLAPTLSVSEPVDDAITGEATIVVRGTATPADSGDSVTVTVNGRTVELLAEGAFVTNAELNPGSNLITITAVNSYGVTRQVTRRVVRGVALDGGGIELPDAGEVADPAPTLTVEAPLEGAALNALSIAVNGQVQGGTLPLQVTVGDTVATVFTRYYSASLVLLEGEHQLSIRVTDARGRTASLTRNISVDRTAPILEIDRPESNPAQVSESPYRIEGGVIDTHLAGVVVQGTPVMVLADRFGASVALQSGSNEIRVEAVDSAGNRSLVTLQLSLSGTPPVVSILEPQDGIEAQEAMMHVRAHVTASAALSQVTIGAGPATDAGNGDFTADVALALGENAVTVTALDVNGLSSSRTVRVRYKDPAQEPLQVTGVEPAAGSVDVEPDTLVSVTFNKAVNPESILNHLTVSASGTALRGGYSVAPGGQLATFVAESALPENARIMVRVSGVAAEIGPGMAADFVSDFTVRRPLTVVRGIVVDREYQAVPGVSVTLESSGLSDRTGVDGNWAIIGAPAGETVVRYEGGKSSDGLSYPTVRRRLYVTAEKENKERTLVLTPVENSSAEYVDGSQPMQIGFRGKYPGLSVELPANGFAFLEGTTAGFVTATKIFPQTMPVPIDGKASLTEVWQVGPSGTRVMAPATLFFPNTTLAPPGRLALLMAFDGTRYVMSRVGFGRVSSDGGAIQSLGTVSINSIEYLGYMVLTAEQHASMESAIGAPDAGEMLPGDAGASLLYWDPRQPKRSPWLKARLAGLFDARDPLSTLFAPFESVAHAQLGGVYLGGFDTMMSASAPAYVVGKVRAPTERMVSMKLTAPDPTLLPLTRSIALGDGLDVELEANYETNDSLDQTSQLVEAQMDVWGPTMKIAPEPGWVNQSSAGKVIVRGTVQLTEVGTYSIVLTAKSGFDQRSMALSAEVSPSPVDAGVGQAELRVTKVSDTSEVDAEPFQGVVRFVGIPVEVTGPGTGQSGVTSEIGGYRVAFSAFGGEEMGISCATVPMGSRVSPRTDAYGVLRFERVPAEAPSCSVSYTIYPGSISKADVLIDARLLHGSIRLADRTGKPLPAVCRGGHTAWDPVTGEVERISEEDVGTTEVHFFREGNLEQAVAMYALTAPEAMDCEYPEDPPEAGPDQTHGSYGRVRFGPTTASHRATRRQCYLTGSTTGECARIGENFSRLETGDRLVVFAINHATGYAGMTTVVVPPINHIQRGPNGVCLADEEAGGPAQTVENGQAVSLSRCTIQELGIPGNVVLYPPEIDLRVERKAEDLGVKRAAQAHLIRHGGAGTTRDSYVAVSTHWRVRTAPVSIDDGSDAGLDGGVAFDAGGAQEAEPAGRIHEVGDGGQLLEVFCSKLPLSARTRGECVKEDLPQLVDVPAGVAGIAGHVVRIPRAAGGEIPYDKPFEVKPGRGMVSFDPSVVLRGSNGQLMVLNGLKRANYYVHLVGNRIYPRDVNLNGIIEESEKNSPPPNFEEPTPDAIPAEYTVETYPHGLPVKAVSVKNVFRHYEDDGLLLERYDRAREHEFRVIELAPGSDAGVAAIAIEGSAEAPDGGAVTAERPLTGSSPSAEITDEEYQLLLSLLEPDDPGRAGTLSGEYSVRLGTDQYGLECQVNIDALNKTLTGTCGGESLEEVLSAEDILYIELYLSGNAENVLYRFNFYGIAPRVDYLAASSAYTAVQAVKKDEPRPVPGRPVSSLSLARFFVSPDVLTSGKVSLCRDSNCQSVLKEANLTLNQDGSYAVVGQSGSIPWNMAQTAVVGAEGARRFVFPLPAELDEMPGASNVAGGVWLKTEAVTPTPKVEVKKLGTPKGSSTGANARAAGQMTIGGVDVADGHLTLSYRDYEARQFAEEVEFRRTYNNQSQALGVLGNGWTHGFEGYFIEERVGRYAVILDGQSYEFRDCDLTDEVEGTASGCQTNNAHGGELVVKKRGSGELYAIFTEGVRGKRYLFGQLARHADEYGRRRWLLTATDDGHARGGAGWNRDNWTGEEDGSTKYSYLAGTDLLSSVKRTPGELEFVFDYWPGIDTTDKRIPYKVRNEGREGFRFLKSVTAGGTSIEFTQSLVGNLEEVKVSGAPKQRWVYGYEAPLSGAKYWSALNELATAELRLTDGTGEEPYFTQWRGSWGRGSAGTKAGYKHLDSNEMVTTVVLPGQQGTPYTISYDTELNRTITRPDGVEIGLELNEYGNVLRTTLPMAIVEASWKSTVLGELVAKDTSTSGTGMRLGFATNERLQPTGATLSQIGADTKPVKGVTSGTQLMSAMPNEMYGVADQMTFRSNGNVATLNTPHDGQGNVTRVSLEDASGTKVLREVQSYDVEGVPNQETDSLGRTITYSNKNGRGLPQTVIMQLTNAAEGALSQVTRNIQYDAIGRVTRVEEQETGGWESWSYDSLGRLLSHTKHGTPDETESYSYLPGDNQLTVEGRIGGQLVSKRELVDGLLDKEKTYYGAANAEAQKQYSYLNGRLDKVVDERGTTHEYQYDANGRLTSVLAKWTDAATQAQKTVTEVSYALDGDGKPRQITGDNGQITLVEYDELGRAARWDYGDQDVEAVMRDGSGAIVERSFGSAHKLSMSVDAQGRALTTQSAGTVSGINSVAEYDAAGRVISSRDDEVGLIDIYEYKDVVGRLTRHERTVQTPEGAKKLTEVRTYQDAERPQKVTIVETIEGATGGSRTKTTMILVDAAGKVLQRRETVPAEQESVHQYSYDARGKVISYLDPLLRPTSWSYDAAGNLISIIEPGSIATITPDASGLVTSKVKGTNPVESWSFEYDGLKRPTKKTLSAYAGVPEAVWSYEYLGGGQERETTPRAVIERRLNARGKLISESRTGGTQSQNSAYEYDGEWLKKLTVIEGTSTTVVERPSIDDRGRVLSEQKSWERNSQSYSYTTTTSWSGRSAQVTQTWGGGSRTANIAIDSLGNLVSRTQGGLTDEWRHDVAGLLTWSQAAGKPRVEQTYLEGLLSQTTMGSEATSYSYYVDGRQHTMVDPSGRTLTSEWDNRGLLSAQEYGMGGTKERTEFEYDDGGYLKVLRKGAGTSDQAQWNYVNGAQGEVLSVTMPNSLGTFGYEYFADRLLKKITPAGGVTEEFDYDYLGRPALRRRGTSPNAATWVMSWESGERTVLDPNGDEVKEQLDGLGRVARRQYMPGPNSAANTDLTEVQYAYDPLGQLLTAVETRNSGNITTTYGYNPRGRLNQITRGALSVGYGYTASDDIATLTSPAGTQTYGYDSNGRLGQVTTARGTTHFAWEPGGARLTGIWDSASYEKRCYDGAGRLESVIGADEDAGCPTSLDSLTGVNVYAAFRYTRDARGNPVTEQYLSPLGPPAEGRSYGYDSADRLVGVSYADGSAVLYGLRGDGVRLGEKHFASYVGALGDYSSATGASEHHTYGFDARGGLSGVFDQLLGGAQIGTFVTDPGGRLTSETWTSGFQRQYGWDADGRLTRITVSNGGSPVTTNYRYDHAGLRRTRIPASGTNTEYLWGAEGLVEERTGATILDYERAGEIVTGVLGVTGTNSERIFHDGLESVAARLPSGSTNPIRYRFDAWGGFQGAGGPISGEPSLAYAGHSADTDVGLSYAQQRWYDPGTGRWLSPDPVFGDLANPNSLMTWGYANGNPVRYTDPSGEKAWERLMAQSLEREAEERLKAAKPETPDHQYAMSRFMLAQKYRASDEQSQDFTRNVGLPIVGQGLTIAALGPLAAASTTVQMGLAVYGAFEGAIGAASVVTGTKVDIGISSLWNGIEVSAYKPCNGAWWECERLWGGVEAASTLTASFAGGASINKSLKAPWRSGAQTSTQGEQVAAQMTRNEADLSTAMAQGEQRWAGMIADLEHSGVPVGMASEPHAPITDPSRLLASGTTKPNAGGVIRSFVQESERTYFRVYSGDKTVGSYLLAVPPPNGAYATEALALSPGNSADFLQEVIVPAGSRLQRSRAIPVPEWGRYRGGAEQFQLLEHIPTKNYRPGRRLR
jgi:RHS repeat-associated protein